MKAAFLHTPRQERPALAERERLRSWTEFHAPLPASARRAQASRCMDCGVPYCQSGYGCPLHNLIPEWNGLLAAGLERQAFDRLIKTASFPEFTGRVCPALCEKACNLAERDGATTVRDNELYLIEKGFAEGWMQPRTPEARTGKRAAIVGSGPAGLAAADWLNRAGHTVTVYEKADRCGGLLRYGIPGMKLEKAVIDRRLRLMEQEGVCFVTGASVDASLTGRYDAVLLCCGAGIARTLPLANERVHYAVPFLTEATRALQEGRAPGLHAEGKRVIVVGGGDTGNDCVATCLRQGCRSITQIELLPRPPACRPCGNPWPEWPRVLKTDYGQQEALAVNGADPRVYETTVKAFEGDRALTVRMRRDGDGRFREVPGSERELPCDLLLVAAGFVGCDPAVAEAFQISRDERGNLGTLSGSHRLRDNLFAAGDAHTGQSLVVRAIADGRDAAAEADGFLRG